MRTLTLSLAAVALVASAAQADPGKGNGNGKDKGKPPAAKVERGNGGKSGPPNKVERRAGPAMKAGANKGGNGKADRRPVRADDNRSKPWAAPGAKGNDRKDDNRRGGEWRGEGKSRDVRYVDRGDNFSIFRDFDRRSSAYDGCPPGLAKNYNGCMPPGLAKKRASYRPSWFGYNGYGDTRFYYDDGFLIRIGSGGRIAASIPLLGGALAIGNPWPSYYQPVEVRPYYRSFYGLQPDGYRYAGNAIYRVDPKTAAITSVAALLTGDDFVIGQPVPAGYPVYNVPYRYRDRYVDGPNAYYRYSDGYVYQVDPKTRLVAAAIELLVD